MEKRIFGGTIFRFLLASAVISCFLTTVVVVSVDIVENSNSVREAFSRVFSGWSDAFGQPSHKGHARRFVALGFLINFVFDSFTLYLTVVLLRVALMLRYSYALLVLVVDVAAAAALAVLCGALGGWLLFDERVNVLWGGEAWGSSPLSAWMVVTSKLIVKFFAFDWLEGAGLATDDVSLGAFSATALIPSAIYLSFIAVLLIAKLIAEYLAVPSAWLVGRLIREDPKSDIDKFKPFTLLGILLSAVASLLGVAGASMKVLSDTV